MRRVYVAGAGGMLGHAVYQVFSEDYDLECSDINLNADWLRPLDFRDYEAYSRAVHDFNPDLLIHLGAHTDLEYCEAQPSDAYLTNTISVEHACGIANEIGVPIVYVSTAGIFDGAKERYDDWDCPNPLGVYARSKYLGEIAVQQRVERHFVVRAGWMMGGGPGQDKKFIAKLMDQLRAGADQLRIVDDKLGTPTYTLDFARNLSTLVQTKHYGLYNMVCEGETGRIEIAEELLRVLELDDAIALVPVSSSHFAATYSAPRPKSERLINYKLNLLGLNTMRDWRSALREYVLEYYAGFLD